MSESKNTETKETIEEENKSPLALILTIFVVLAVVIVIGLINNSQTVNDLDKAAGSDELFIENNYTDALEVTIPDVATETPVEIAVELDLDKAATPRIMGNPDAPIKISEHSSFTCGACAAFHKDNFKQIKKEYVDTGKAYIVFDDFPRNLYDIQIGAITRCVPETAYFNFVQLLFETQSSWLNEGFLPHIKQNAKLTGVSEAKINSCLNSEELKEILAQRQGAAHENHGVKSTPTLIINDIILLSGLDPYSKIKRILDAELEKAGQ